MTPKNTAHDTTAHEAPMTDPFLLMTMVSTPEHPSCGEKLKLTFTATNEGDDALINVRDLTFTFVPGPFPASLCVDFSKVTTTNPPGWSIREDSGVFTATPPSKTDKADKPDAVTYAPVGPEALVFEIADIVVNSKPGTTDVTMTQAVKAPNDTGADPKNPPPDLTKTDTVHLTKIWPALKIRDVHAKPQTVDFKGMTTVFWDASLGSIITLKYDGISINHIKGDAAVPLPSTGSYDIETARTQDTTFTISAQSGPGMSDHATQTQQTIVSIAPPTVELTITGDSAPLATLEWATTSIDKNPVLTITSGTDTKTKTLDPSGTLTHLLFDKTTFSLTAKNPATVVATTATKDVEPGQYSWTKVGDGPDPSAPATQIFSSHLGLILVTSSMPQDFKKGDTFNEYPNLPLKITTPDVSGMGFPGGATAKTWAPKYPYNALYLSRDAIDWEPCGDFPFVQHTGQITMAHGGGRTYLAMPGGEKKFDGTVLGKPSETLFYVTTDFVEWTPLPSIKTVFNDPVPICVDDDGALYAVAYVRVIAGVANHQSLWKFSPKDNKWQHLSDIPNSYTAKPSSPAWAYAFVQRTYDYLTIHWIDTELVLLSCLSFRPTFQPTDVVSDYAFVGTHHLIDATNTLRSSDGVKWDYVPAVEVPPKNQYSQVSACGAVLDGVLCVLANRADTNIPFTGVRINKTSPTFTTPDGAGLMMSANRFAPNVASLNGVLFTSLQGYCFDKDSPTANGIWACNI